MTNLFYIYLASGVFFLLVEMLTGTLYGFSVSIACFVLAVYVYVTGDLSVTVTQGLLLVIISAIFAYFLPKWFMARTPTSKLGLDVHIGKAFRLERVGTDWKVKIDGVDHLIDTESETPDFEAGKKVVIEGHNGGILKVSILK